MPDKRARSQPELIWGGDASVLRRRRGQRTGPDRHPQRPAPEPRIEAGVEGQRITRRRVEAGTVEPLHRIAIITHRGQQGRKDAIMARRIEIAARRVGRSEEPTSEIQSLMRISYAVFCLKKKTTNV